MNLDTTDYVGEFSRAKSNTAFTRGVYDGSERAITRLILKPLLTFNGRVVFFTHLTPNAAVRKSLQFIKSSLSQMPSR